MKRIIFSIDDKEALNLQTLLAKYGGKAPAFFKMLLKEAFREEYGGYKSKEKIKPIKEEPEVELTDEQFCLSKGGKISKHNGRPVCLIEYPGGEWKCELELVKEKYKYF